MIFEVSECLQSSKVYNWCLMPLVILETTIQSSKMFYITNNNAKIPISQKSNPKSQKSQYIFFENQLNIKLYNMDFHPHIVVDSLMNIHDSCELHVYP